MPRIRLTHRLAAITAALVLVPGLASAAGPVNGAAGIGDPYYPDYGNGGYDVSHYDIANDYLPGADAATPDKVAGTTTITATATQDLKRFDLDLVLKASAVQVDGVDARFSQPTRHELVVTPATPIASGAPFTVRVTYAGRPSRLSAHGIKPWIRTQDGGAVAVGEPEIAAWWFPSNDHPRDKATFDVTTTLPTGSDLKVLGNGVLVDHAEGDASWHWREARPMTTYLAFFAAGDYTITEGTHNGVPLVTAVAGSGPAAGYAADDLARTPEVLDFESQYFGPYPQDAMGGVAPLAEFGFALENQTRPVYSRLFWNDGPNVGVIVHELAHQWYGDSVSVYNWKHIWLNEGFASFAEWLWDEHHTGPSAAEWFDAYYSGIGRDRPFWKVTIGNPGAGNEFNGAVYIRGAMTLQALRTRIGDTVFFDLMRTWAADHAGGNGRIEEFRDLAEAKSGQDLDSFFTNWLYTPQRPNPTKGNGFPARTSRLDPVSPAQMRRAADNLRLFREHDARQGVTGR